MKTLAGPPLESFTEAERHCYDLSPELEKAYITAIPNGIIEKITKADPEAVKLKMPADPSKTFHYLAPEDKPSHLYRDGWTTKHLLQYLVTLAVPGFNADAPETQKLKQELEDVIGGPDVKVGCAWPCQMALATKL